MKTYVYALIIKDAKVLLLQRPANKKSHANVWNFAGGRLEDGENLPECVIREVKEETGLGFIPISKILDQDYEDDTRIRVVVYLGFSSDGDIELSVEHQNFKYMGIEEIKKTKTMPYIQDLFTI